MTSVNVTTQKNTVTVSTSGQLTTVTATTAGPQGPPGDFELNQSGKVDGSLVYYDATAATFKADAVNTTDTLTDGGNFYPRKHAPAFLSHDYSHQASRFW